MAQNGEAFKAELTIRADQPKGTINRNIYGNFAEHLGRDIYDGIWVGEGSSIPNTRGIRNDIIAALKNLNIPVLRWPGGCFADEYHWRDGVGPRDKRPRRINYVVGQRHRDERLWHARVHGLVRTDRRRRLCRRQRRQRHAPGDDGLG